MFSFFKRKTKAHELIEDRLAFEQEYEEESYRELQSWSVIWYVKEGWGNSTLRNAKVFTDKEAADGFKDQLNTAAKLLRCWVKVEVSKND